MGDIVYWRTLVDMGLDRYVSLILSSLFVAGASFLLASVTKGWERRPDVMAICLGIATLVLSMAEAIVPIGPLMGIITITLAGALFLAWLELGMRVTKVLVRYAEAASELVAVAALALSYQVIVNYGWLLMVPRWTGLASIVVAAVFAITSTLGLRRTLPKDVGRPAPSPAGSFGDMEKSLDDLLREPPLTVREARPHIAQELLRRPGFGWNGVATPLPPARKPYGIRRFGPRVSLRRRIVARVVYVLQFGIYMSCYVPADFRPCDAREFM